MADGSGVQYCAYYNGSSRRKNTGFIESREIYEGCKHTVTVRVMGIPKTLDFLQQNARTLGIPYRRIKVINGMVK